VRNGDATGGVGGAQEGRDELTVRVAIALALELPCCEAADVEVELVQSGVAGVMDAFYLEHLHWSPPPAD